MIRGSCLCGSVRWLLDGQPDGATARNCTACRRYGVLWAYDHENEGIEISGRAQAYVRGKALEFHFLPHVRLRGVLARPSKRTSKGGCGSP